MDDWLDRENFSFYVNAVNVRNKTNELIGEAVVRTVQFHAIGSY